MKSWSGAPGTAWPKDDPLAAEGMRAFVEKREPVWVQEASGTPA